MENNTSQAPTTVPPPPIQTQQPIPSSPGKEPHSRKAMVGYLIAIVTLVLGLGIGYLIRGTMIQPIPATEPSAPEKMLKEVTLPSGAVQIQACANNKGALYVKPEDIPVGPIYMVHKGKVIGIEFMLGKEEFLSGKSFKFLSGLGMNVNHVNIGLLSEGHEGYTAPHYHVDLYLVDKEIESAIICTGTPTTPPGTATSPSASPSGGILQPATSIIVSPTLTQ